MVRIEVDVCAICRQLGKDVQHVDISIEGRTVFSDVLCEDDLAPLASILSGSVEGGSATGRTDHARPPRAPSKAPQRAKKAAKKAPTKKTRQRALDLPVLTEEQARKMGL